MSTSGSSPGVGSPEALTRMDTMSVTLTLLLTLLAGPPQVRRLYMEQLKDEALRDSATVVRASESLTDLFESWAGRKLAREEFNRLAGQRLKLIRESSRRLSSNPLLVRIDRVKKQDRKAQSGNASQSSPQLSLEEIPSTLDAITRSARMVRKQVEQFDSQSSGPAPPGRGAGPATVTLGELQAPRIGDLCKEMRAAAERVAARLEDLD